MLLMEFVDENVDGDRCQEVVVRRKREKKRKRRSW
jgi:hypothetical protein